MVKTVRKCRNILKCLTKMTKAKGSVIKTLMSYTNIAVNNNDRIYKWLTFIYNMQNTQKYSQAFFKKK